MTSEHSQIFDGAGIVERTYLSWDHEALLFLVRTRDGTCYLGNFVEEETDGTRCTLYVELSDDAVDAVETGAVSIREAFLLAANKKVTLVRVRDSVVVSSREIEISTLDESWLAHSDARLRLRY
jgi:hypothetical protein